MPLGGVKYTLNKIQYRLLEEQIEKKRGLVQNLSEYLVEKAGGINKNYLIEDHGEK